MGPFAAGQVVLLPFPFSNLSREKLRPVLLLADAGREDWIVCQITSNPYADRLSITLTQEAFIEGGLERRSYVRPGKLFTAHESLMEERSGSIHMETLNAVRNSLIKILRASAI